MVSRRRRNTSLHSGGCVDIVVSGEEGAGASSAVGQASAVHGVAGSRVERARRGPRSRCISVGRDELNTPLQDLPQRRRGRVRPASGLASGPSDQLALPVPGGTHRDRRSAPFRDERACDRRPTLPAPSAISRELRRNAPTGRDYQPFDAHRRATARRARHHQRRSTPTITSTPWLPNCLANFGARSRSAVICV